jgi:DNA (cytosine-5)-methyltransferase 1
VTRPRLLDLFCGAGGAAMGYHRAGFDVVGVDIAPQPSYPFEFVQADALEFLAQIARGGGWETKKHDYHLEDFDAIHASPPCQAHTALRVMENAREHPDLVGPTRDLLEAARLPWVIENVVGAPLVDPVTVCGASLGLGTLTHDLARHRLFESNCPLLVPRCAHRSRKVIGIYGDHARLERRHRAGSQYNAVDSLRYGSEAMGIDWMTWPELTQAIPPAYTELIGHQLMQHVRAGAAA